MQHEGFPKKYNAVLKFVLHKIEIFLKECLKNYTLMFINTLKQEY